MTGPPTDGGRDLPPVRVTGLDHVVLYAEDVEGLADFYAALLDARVVAYGDGWRSVRFPGGAVNLRPVDGDFELVGASPTAGAGDLCLLTESPVEALLERLSALGVSVVEGPVERPGARGPMTSVYVEDPEGNLLELARYHEG